MRSNRKDGYYRKAKAEGLRSRAAFKLQDLAGKHLRPGGRVVDLGCWPGSWMQIALEQVGESGRVVGVDLAEAPPLAAANATVLVGDVREPEVIEQIAQALGGQADLVLSDLAPKLTGIRAADQARAETLTECALDTARRLLRPGGAFICKVFMNGAFEATRAEARRHFVSVKVKRPPATRKGSAELYLIAENFRPPPAPPGAADRPT